MPKQIDFRIYPTLLDAFTRYLRAADIHEELWGFSEQAPEFRWEDAERELIDRINRVEFKSEAAERGTAFNMLVDAIANDQGDIPGRRHDGTWEILQLNGTDYMFNSRKLHQIAERYRDAIAQVYVERTIDTRHGRVLLYGYIDELLPDVIVDIKTTRKFKVNKFRHNWQHIVYPYCVNNRYLRDFRYDVVILDKNGNIDHTATDCYSYVPERDEPRLRTHIEGLIDFVLEHRDRITDKRFFCEDE